MPGKQKQILAYATSCREMLKKGDTLSVLLVGVGGQGIVLAAAILAETALKGQLEAKVSEIHGMSQRGGSVVGTVRMGKQVFSPTADRADFIVAFEKLEALRYCHLLKPHGLMVVNNYEIVPVSETGKCQGYPDDIISQIKEACPRCILIDAHKLAKKLGQPRTANVILLGFLSNILPWEETNWIESIKQNVPPGAADINIEAFYQGRKY